MKILWNNYLSDSTVTASDEDTQYPVSNLTDVFLELKFQSTSNQSMITVEFPEDRDVSMIAYGYQNLVDGAGEVVRNVYGSVDILTNTYGADEVYRSSLSAGYKLINSSGTTLASGQLNIDDDVSITYLDSAVTCRSVEILFTADDTLYIGGLAIGDPLEYEYVEADAGISDIILDSVDKTNGGQVIGEAITMLRQWAVAVPHPEMTNAKRLETRTMVKAIGSWRPVFADLWEDSDDEPPMYGNLIEISTMTRNSYSRDYDFNFTIEEAR